MALVLTDALDQPDTVQLCQDLRDGPWVMICKDGDVSRECSRTT
ncbi:hypothetical protein [Streptomyces sp. NPDC047718]